MGSLSKWTTLEFFVFEATAITKRTYTTLEILSFFIVFSAKYKFVIWFVLLQHNIVQLRLLPLDSGLGICCLSECGKTLSFWSLSTAIPFLVSLGLIGNVCKELLGIWELFEVVWLPFLWIIYTRTWAKEIIVRANQKLKKVAVNEVGSGKLSDNIGNIIRST